MDGDACGVSDQQRDDEGFTAYRRWKRREFTKPVAEFGEFTVGAPALSVGKDKFDSRRKEGAWLGIKAESGESSTGTSDGVVKARDFRRNPENGGRWSREDLDKFRGVPWEPYPGAGGGYEVRSKVRLLIDPAEFTEIVKGKSEFTRRRFII